MVTVEPTAGAEGRAARREAAAEEESRGVVGVQVATVECRAVRAVRAAQAAATAMVVAAMAMAVAAGTVGVQGVQVVVWGAMAAPEGWAGGPEVVVGTVEKGEMEGRGRAGAMEAVTPAE